MAVEVRIEDLPVVMDVVVESSVVLVAVTWCVETTVEGRYTSVVTLSVSVVTMVTVAGDFPEA